VETGLLLAVVEVVSRPRAVYGSIWVVSRPIVLGMEIAAVLAIFGRWTESYPGIGKFGRSLVVVLMAISIGVAVSTLPVAWSADGWSVVFQLITIANRATNLCLGVFLLLTLGFFYKFGGPVASNLRRHTWAMTAYVMANMVSYFVMSNHMFKLSSLLFPAVSLAAITYWIFAFRQAGEQQPAVTGNRHEWDTVEALNVQLQRLADSVTPSGARGTKRRK
jgi:hypothetical protein